MSIVTLEPEVVVQEGNDVAIIATGSQGPQGIQGDTGAAGEGVPAGGSTSQHLAKASGDDYDTEWVTPPSVDDHMLRLDAVMSASLQAVRDEAGTDSPLQLSTGEVRVNAAPLSFGADLDVTRYHDGSLAWLAVDDGGGDGAGDGRVVADEIMLGGTSGARLDWNGSSYIRARNNAGSGYEGFQGDLFYATQAMYTPQMTPFGTNSTLIIHSKNFSSADSVIEAVTGTMTHSSGEVIGLHVKPTLNESSTAGFVGLFLDLTTTAIGSGEHDFIRCDDDGTTYYSVGFDGMPVWPQGYTYHKDIEAASATLGPTAPDKRFLETTIALGFTNAETVNLSFEIPTNWDGGDIELKTYWVNEAGDIIQDTETVKMDFEYRVLDFDAGDTYDNGTVAAITTTYTQSGVGTDKEGHESEMTLAYNDANQPLAAGKVVEGVFQRDNADTYSGELRCFRWEFVMGLTGLNDH